MDKESEKFLENLVYMENNPDWEPLVANFIDQNCQVESEMAENLSSDALQSELEAKMKSVVGSFINKYMKRLRELQGIIDLQNEGTTKLKTEISSLKEENEQLNEMSLTLISQIKKLKKYVNESDILGSILRGEIVKQKHQNKMLVNALKELYDGNEELATKILANTFSNEPDPQKSPPDRILTSPESHYKRHLSLLPDDLQTGMRSELVFRASASAHSARARRKTPGGQSLGGEYESEDIGRVYCATERGMETLDDEENMDENNEYDQPCDFERRLNEALESNEEVYNELYSFEETGNEASEKASEKIESITLGRGSDYVSPSLSIKSMKSVSEKVSPSKFARSVPKIKSLFLRNKEEGGVGKSLFDFENIEPSSATFAAFQDLMEDEQEFPIKKLERIPKWLRPQKKWKNNGTTKAMAEENGEVKNEELKEKEEESVEVIELEDKIEIFVEMNKKEAKFNTEIPLMALMKMPLTGIMDLVTNIFKRDN